MRKIILTLATAILPVVGCKTTNSQTESAVKHVDLPTVCYGNRKFFENDVVGFDFNATSGHLGNAYWASIASEAAYSEGRLNKALMEDWGKTSLRSFQYYGEPPNAMGTEGYFAEFDQGVLLVFRGTAGARDILTDLNRTKFRGKAFNRDGVLEELRIHKGFWDATDMVWKSVLSDLMKSTSAVDLPADSPDAFAQANRVLRGIIQEADIERYDPNQHFLPELKTLQMRGILKSNANMQTLLGVLNIWAEEAMLASRAYVAGVKSGDMTKYEEVLAKGLARKQRNFSRIHPFFNFRKYKPIWLTGHSLGGALATVLTYRFMRMGIPVQGMITYGAPRVGNDIFEYFFETAFQEDGHMLNNMRFQNDNDGVSRIPHMGGWRHVGDPWFIDSNQRLLIRFPPASLNTALRDSINRYPGRTSVAYYHDEVPAGYRGIWNFDLMQFVGDHIMDSQYVKHIENYVFGERAPGCN